MKFWKLLVLCVAACCPGCSGDDLNRVSAEGTVTLDGQPLEKGFISFFPLHNEGPSVGTKIVSGKYHFDKKTGPAVGEYRVDINGEPVPSGKKIPSSMNPTVMEDEMIDSIPEKYHSGGAMGMTSEPVLKAALTAGKNHIDFPLSSK